MSSSSKPVSLALLAMLCLSGLSGGCARTYTEYTPEALQREMDRAAKNSAEAWFYAGSEGGFHYIVARAGTNPKWIKISSKSMRLDMQLTARSLSPSSWTAHSWHGRPPVPSPSRPRPATERRASGCTPTRRPPGRTGSG